jgi:hypothetical protein
MSHRIDIAVHRIGQRGTYYRVEYRGRTLIESSREPLFNACRALVAMGIKGRLEVWGGESYPRMIVHDIERGARRTVIENDDRGPRFARYQPNPLWISRAWHRATAAIYDVEPSK